MKTWDEGSLRFEVRPLGSEIGCCGKNDELEGGCQETVYASIDTSSDSREAERERHVEVMRDGRR